MAVRRTDPDATPRKRRPPATTPLAREQQLVAKAYDLAEKQLEDGTASAQVISSFLKLGSSREHLEQQRMRHEIELMEAKKEQMKQAERIELLFTEAIDAFRSYSGQPTQRRGEFEDEGPED